MSESKNTGDVSSRLAELRERFVVRATSDLLALEALASGFSRGGVDRAQLFDACQRLHRLAGSAGTFGLPELGESARALEKNLKAAVEQADQDGVDPVPVSGDVIQRMVALRSMLQGRGQQGPLSASSRKESTSPDGVHGLRIGVAVITDGADGGAMAPLRNDLEAYGFDCRLVSGSDQAVEAALRDWGVGAMVLLCDESRMEAVAAIRGSINGTDGGCLSLIALGPEDSFHSRYQVAGLGADAFFCHPPNLPELTERIEYLALERTAKVQGRVAIVEDDTELAEHYALVLKTAGIEVCSVTDPMELMGQLSSFQPDIVLMDVQLGRFSGETLARMVRFYPQWLSLPIIYLSSEDDPDNQLTALSRGADEFLVKPVSDSYLVRAVQIRCFRARQLSRLMNRDSLTGLLKHSLIKQEVEKELARCRREGHESCVVMVDLDHFKSINDTWGHPFGDTVIRTLANFLRNRLRETDMIGRYGGEEFLVVLPRCTQEAAAELFREIAEGFSQLTFTSGPETFHVTLSAGVSAVGHHGSGEQAVEAADQALYLRKKAGRNGVTVYGMPGTTS
ncbi:diguanylate cyclase [Marinobacter oulmenensis]|uniref:diguanylate cyclase n=1 Tax=Marinobacter oulmenensis TaxID=643747 RepID=A0A840U1S1_9GAMM|nr:diguanylate cyclase [Marinobacter oulmenensis]MBB5319634.1 diguanylate cyclase (GGDEF)-like protein [Marinobacter oulmenensis]